VGPQKLALRRLLAGASAAAVAAVIALGIASGCASTEYPIEGAGAPSDRASGNVPYGSLGVCKKPFTKRPPIVSETLWENARTCTPRTPPEHIRIGYGRTTAEGGNAEADQRVEKSLQALRDTPKSETGNVLFSGMIRQLRDYAMGDPDLRDRVGRSSPLATPCDFKYLLTTMSASREKLDDDKCTVKVYDAKQRAEACLFDTAREEALYLTSSWDCVAHTNAVGQEQSCYRLCGYDDYCARQVSCAAPDIDLLLCSMGVCLPQPIASVQ
jgi:hypothetical protein